MVTNASALSTEMKVAKAPESLSLLLSRRPFPHNTELITSYQVRDKFQSADHVVITLWRFICRENHLLVLVSSNFGGIHCDGQSVVFTPVSSEELRAPKAYFRVRPGFDLAGRLP